MSEASTLAEARRQLEAACAHLSECVVLYGDKRLDRGIPTDRSWALLPLCRALQTMMDELDDLEQRVRAIEERSIAATAFLAH